MTDVFSGLSTLAVFPVLLGPLQTLLALLPAILVGVASMLFAVFKPGGFVKLVRFCWRQKVFGVCVAAVLAGWHYGVFANLFERHRSLTDSGAAEGTNWNALRGGPLRLGRGPGDDDPTTSAAVWKNDRDATVYSSPAVSGSRVLFATATGMGPFTPEGHGAIVCVDAESGREIWRYAPADYRATFSSPVVQDGFVVCGEGLHQVQDARVTCLDGNGRKRWEFRTKSHVESTAAIADGKVFFGAGDDGFYCLSLEPTADGQPRVLWHLEGDQFPDCESSPAVSGDTVYFGLGEGGFAICAVDAQTGSLRWRIDTPYPVFAPPTVAEGKLYFATGNGNFVQSAADLLEMKLALLRDGGASEQQLAEARLRLRPAGEVWCVDLATQRVDWKFSAGDAILGAVVRGDDSLYFGSRDGWLYRISLDGRLLRKFDLHEPIVSSPALGRKHVYCATLSGRLFGCEALTLKPVWDASLGGGEAFVSSPVVAYGHVYVGTAEQGLRCLGRPGAAELPLWSRGERGGSADEERVSETLSVAWQYPAEGDPPLAVTAPLMPLDGAIYVTGLRDGATQLIKLSADQTKSAEQRLLWSQRLTGSINVAPVGCGQRVCVVVDRTLSCLSADGGHSLWTQPLAGESKGLAVDAKQVIAWSGDHQLAAFDLMSGAALWQASLEGSQGVGAPAIADNIVFATTDTHLSARDAPTGGLLWQVRLTKSPSGSPFVEGLHVVVTQGEQQTLHSLIDGAIFSRRPATNESDSWRIPDGIARPITPRVALRGRVYFATESGSVICLEPAGDANAVK